MSKQNTINESRNTNHETRSSDPIQQMIDAKVVMAPMSGITDIPFRSMIRKYGCKFAFTEMVDVNGLAYRNAKTLDLMKVLPEDQSMATQLVGDSAEKMLSAAKLCEEKGFKLLDINAGCPARKVTKCGKGSSLMKDPAKLAGIVKALVSELSIPVTVKIRSGWDENSLNYLEVGKAVEAAGASAVCLHPRTREQMYKGKADHDMVRKLKEELKIPVFASGNIFNAEDARNVFEQTGCDAVFIARGALGSPWIFEEAASLLSGEKFDGGKSFDEIKDVILEHFIRCVEFYGEGRSFSRMYKHLTWYLKKRKKIHETMQEYLKLTSFDDFKVFLKRLHLNDKNCLELV